MSTKFATDPSGTTIVDQLAGIGCSLEFFEPRCDACSASLDERCEHTADDMKLMDTIVSTTTVLVDIRTALFRIARALEGRQ